MQENQTEQLENIRSTNEQLTQMQTDYWQSFTHLGTWQFWVDLAFLVVPLIILFFAIDRKKAFLLGFFGFNYHVWFRYADTIMVQLGLWEYPHQFFPLAGNFSVDAALTPVIFMLFYQWALNHNKNVYFYGLILSAILGFVFIPILEAMGFFRMFDWVNYVYLFLFYYLIFLVSKMFTNIFIWLKNRA